MSGFGANSIAIVTRGLVYSTGSLGLRYDTVGLLGSLSSVPVPPVTSGPIVGGGGGGWPPVQIWLPVNGQPVQASSWIDASWSRNISLQAVEFASGDIVQIRVSNKPTRPLDSDNQAQFGSDITSDSLTVVTYDQISGQINNGYAWIKVIKSAAGASPAPTKAYLLLQGPSGAYHA
jgi:hypothetical protein